MRPSMLIRHSRILVLLSLLHVLEGWGLGEELVLFKREENTKCGPHAVFLLEKFYGYKPQLERILENSAYRPSGTSIRGLRNALELDGFEVEARKYDPQIVSFEDFDFPFIAHVADGTHFIFVPYVGENLVVVADPPDLYLMRYSEFRDAWNGNAIVARPRRESRRRPGTLSTNGQIGGAKFSPIQAREEAARTRPPSVREAAAEVWNTVPLRPLTGIAQDWEEVEAGETLLGSFPIRNLSERPVTIIDLATDCNCTSVTLSKRLIQPQDVVQVEYAIDTTNRVGVFEARLTLRVSLGEEASNQARLFLFVTYESFLQVDVSPSIVRLGRVDLRDLAGQTATVTLSPNARSTTVAIQAITASSDLVRIDFDRSVIGQRLVRPFVLDLSFPATLTDPPTRKLRESIEIRLTGAEQERIVVPVEADLSNTIDCYPQLVLIRPPPDRSIHDRENQSRVELALSTEFQDIDLRAMSFGIGRENRNWITLRGVQPDSKHRVRLTLLIDYSRIAAFFMDHESAVRFEDQLRLTVNEDDGLVFPISLLAFREPRAALSN